MIVSNVFIAVMWVWFLSGGFAQGLAMPYIEPLPPAVEKLALLIVLFPVVVGVPLADDIHSTYLRSGSWSMANGEPVPTIDSLLVSGRSLYSCLRAWFGAQLA